MSATLGESTILRSKSAQDGTQDGPRSPQDGSKIVLDRLFGIFNYRFFFASFWVPFWCRFGLPNAPGKVKLGVSAPEGVQDGLEIVLVRFSCRLVVRDRFFRRRGLLLGSILGAPEVILVLFRHFNSSIQPIKSSTRRFNPSTHQPIGSTRQPINSSIQPFNPSIQLVNSSTLDFYTEGR